MSIEQLQEKINSASDARLRRQIDVRVDHLRTAASRLGVITFKARDASGTGQPVEVAMKAADMVNLVATAAYEQRRDQAREQATRDFLEKVIEAGIEL